MNKEDWLQRIARRTDFTSGLVHLTKSQIIDKISYSGLDILMKILDEQILKGSTTKSGFISGSTPAVCFQDVPLFSLSENIYYEQYLKKKTKAENYRYMGFGLRFSKDFIFKNSGRPVIYDKTDDAKKYLPISEYWRIVNLDFSNENNYIDWMHEREWRVPGNLEFDLSEVDVLIHSGKTYKEFIDRCRAYKSKDILKEIKSLITLPPILF